MNDWLNFEIYIGDLIVRQEIATGEALSKFAEELHEHVENAVCDYAMDEGFYDYEAVF